MMGSLELEKEMKHKPANCNGVTGKDIMGSRNISKLQLPAEKNPGHPGFFSVSSNFTYYDGKVFTQVEKMPIDNTSGSPAQQKWLKLGSTGSDQESIATPQPRPLVDTDTTISTNSTVAVESGQPILRLTTAGNCQNQSSSRTPESCSTIPTSCQPAVITEQPDPVTTASPSKSSSDAKMDTKHHYSHSLGVVSKPSEWIIQNQPDHEYAAAPRGIRLKIKRENIKSPVWVSESIEADIFSPNENQGLSQETQEKMSHKHNRSKSYSSKLPRVPDHEIKLIKNGRLNNTQSDAPAMITGHHEVNLVEEEKSLRNQCEDNALFETLNTKQEQKSSDDSNQRTRSKPVTSQMYKQASSSKLKRSGDLFYAPRPSNKRSQLVNQESPLFNIYEIVWAKMVDRPWWPARVLSYGQSYGSGAPKTMESASVKWLGRPTTCASSLPSSLLMPFVDGFVQNYDSTSTKSTYIRAIREALEIFGFNPDDPMAFYDYCKKLSETPNNTNVEERDGADTENQEPSPTTATNEQSEAET
jgi:Flp pilus assembly protein TadG